MRRLRLREQAALVTELTKGRAGRLVGILAIESAMRRDALRVAVRPGMLTGGPRIDGSGGTG